MRTREFPSRQISWKRVHHCLHTSTTQTTPHSHARLRVRPQQLISSNRPHNRSSAALALVGQSQQRRGTSALEFGTIRWPRFLPSLSTTERTFCNRRARIIRHPQPILFVDLLAPPKWPPEICASKETPCRRAAFRLVTNSRFIRSSWRLLAGVILVLGDKLSSQRLATPSRHTLDLDTSDRQHESSYRNLRARDFGWSATSVNAGASSLILFTRTPPRSTRLDDGRMTFHSIGQLQPCVDRLANLQGGQPGRWLERRNAVAIRRSFWLGEAVPEIPHVGYIEDTINQA